MPMGRMESKNVWISEAPTELSGRNEDGVRRLEPRDEWKRDAMPTTRVMDFNTLIGMGFERNESINAIKRSDNLNGAVDMLLNQQLSEMNRARVPMEDDTVVSGIKQTEDIPIRPGGRIVEKYVVTV